MYVGVLKVAIRIIEAFSLKDKRRILRSVFEKTRTKFQFSCGEVDNEDIINFSTFGFSCISNSYSHVEERLNTLINFLEEDFRFEIVDVRREIYNVN